MNIFLIFSHILNLLKLKKLSKHRNGLKEYLRSLLKLILAEVMEMFSKSIDLVIE